MPTSVDYLKAQTAPFKFESLSIVLFCMFGLVASLVFFSVMSARDVSDIAQLIGP